MSRRLSPWIVAAGAAAVTLTAFRAASEPAQQVVVTARDFAFQAPDTIAAGVTEFRLHNVGPSLHHVTLLRLGEGKTLADLYHAMGPGAPLPVWAVLIGGPNSPAPGAWASATLSLTPGHYAMICVIPDSAGVPHLAHGMAKEVVVTGTAKGALPRADLSVNLLDYAFKWSRVPRAGKQSWLLSNGATQPHEMLVVRLAPGKTAQAFLAWVETGFRGSAPGTAMGGVAAMAPGEENVIDLDLAPGRYALICFVPDARDGKPHVAHGMVEEFEVRGG